jgi:uncharacterized membrane protein YoaK (UPF0700 family)
MHVSRIVAPLLSFTAGFVDSRTFLALFGVYVAGDRQLCGDRLGVGGARRGLHHQAPATVLAAMVGLSAMGVQSALVRLLMPGAASTNVMTTNTTTLFAIDTGELLLGWHGKRKGDVEAAAQSAAARERLSHLIPLGIGFFLGTAVGAVA